MFALASWLPEILTSVWIPKGTLKWLKAPNDICLIISSEFCSGMRRCVRFASYRFLCPCAFLSRLSRIYICHGSLLLVGVGPCDDNGLSVRYPPTLFRTACCITARPRDRRSHDNSVSGQRRRRTVPQKHDRTRRAFVEI